MRNKTFKKYHSQINYAGVKRWTLRHDIFRRRLTLIPVHDPARHHWMLFALIVAYVPTTSAKTADHKCKLLCFDSLGSFVFARKWFTKFNAWLQLEYKYRYDVWLGKVICESGNSCTQQNGYDCGVYVCANAYAMCHQISVNNFNTQDKMDQFRVHMANSVEVGHILDKFNYYKQK